MRVVDCRDSYLLVSRKIIETRIILTKRHRTCRSNIPIIMIHKIDNHLLPVMWLW